MNSYSKIYLEQIAKEKGFVRDNLEKVMRLSEILCYLNQNEVLHKSLVLKGGTAINLTVFQMPRLSVDIDLDFSGNVSREQMIESRKVINNEILAYMSNDGYILKHGSKTPHSLDSLVFGYVNSGGNLDNIKIEINYSNRCHVLPMEERSISIDFLGDVKVRALSPLELFAGKINALISRAAVRDVYDVYRMIQAGLFETESERNLLRKILVFYMAVGANCKAEEITLEVKNFSHIENLSFTQVRANLLPVLSRKEKLDFNNMKEQVLCFLRSLLSFTDDEKNFIYHFNKREYRPDVLFVESSIVEQIKQHPMALWKCRPKE